MTNALAIYQDFDGLQRAAMALYKSGYFEDAKSEAQAIVKVMAGAELGVPPFASMSGIHIISGKPTLGSNVIATLVDNDPRYSYVIETPLEKQDQECTIVWYANGNNKGKSRFTMQEANRITTKEYGKVVILSETRRWKNFPSDMLFARAISRGARRFAPGIFGGAPVYTPDEMGVDTDEDGYIEAITVEMPDAEVRQAHPSQPNDDYSPVGYSVNDINLNGQKKYDFQTRPYDADTLKAALAKKAESFGAYNASDKQRNFLGSLLNEFFQDDTKRHEASEWLFGAASTKDMDGAMVKAALDWLNPEKDDGGAYQINPTSKTELSHVLDVALQAAGQLAL